MATQKNNSNIPVITRIFNAPRERVWKAWTDPELVKKWWGPENFTAPEIKIDLRVGGTYLYCMRGKAGPDAGVKDYWSAGTFREIVPTEKIILTDHFSDNRGNFVEPATYGMDRDFPNEARITVTFEDYPNYGGTKTRLTIRYAKPKPEKAFEAMVKSGMEIGWNQSLDKLAAAVP